MYQPKDIAQLREILEELKLYATLAQLPQVGEHLADAAFALSQEERTATAPKGQDRSRD